MKRSFRLFLKDLIHIPDEVLVKIERVGIRKNIKANSIISNAGYPFLRLLFLEEGLIRAYRIMDGKDMTFFFFTSGEFTVDYESFLRETESPLFFESLTDSTYIEFSKANILLLYNDYPEFERVGRIMAENAYLSATSRLKEFQADPLEKRYLRLLDRNAELFQQVPQYHIASYLGVSPQSLSRIRAKLQNKIY